MSPLTLKQPWALPRSRQCPWSCGARDFGRVNPGCPSSSSLTSHLSNSDQQPTTHRSPLIGREPAPPTNRPRVSTVPLKLKQPWALPPRQCPWSCGAHTSGSPFSPSSTARSAAGKQANRQHLEPLFQIRTVDVRLPGKGDSNSHGARPAHLIIKIIKWFGPVGCQ